METPSHTVDNKAIVNEAFRIFDQRTGEILRDVFGIDSVEKLFVGGKHPEEFKGVATGEIAIDKKLAQENVVTLCLVSQAAVRGYKAAERAREIALNHGTWLEESVQLADVSKPYNHPDFNWVGSEKDAPLLKYAQTVMVLSYHVWDNEIRAYRRDNIAPDYLNAKAGSLGQKVPRALMKACGDLFELVAYGFAEMGLSAEAEKMNIVFNELKISNNTLPTPQELAKDILFPFSRGTLDASIVFTERARELGTQTPGEKAESEDTYAMIKRAVRETLLEIMPREAKLEGRITMTPGDVAVAKAEKFVALAGLGPYRPEPSIFEALKKPSFPSAAQA